MASLYVAVGDTPRASDYLNRVEDFYLLRRSPVPVGMEIQHAWLLYNLKDDNGLYPVLTRMDARQDLTSAQRQEVESLWASWAVRRASSAMEAGSVLRGVQMLQAASEQYPDNLTIRRAVAGAYLKVGRSADSLALYKTIPMQDANSGDYQGAIGAAMAASDLAQAELWLRKALDLFPKDPQIMGQAARFEQARGNNQRAADFWRSALAVLPPGSAIQGLENGLVYPPGAYHAPAPGDMKRLLDPRNDPTARSPKLPPLPSYGTESYRRTNSGVVAPQAYQASRQNHPQPDPWATSPSSNPLPNNSAPAYVPQDANAAPRLPVLTEQSATGEADMQTASNDARFSKPAPNSSPAYMGKMNLPHPANRATSAPTAEPTPAQSSPVWTPGLTLRDTSSSAGLRITAQPLDPAAARAQALFAEQTDGQLTDGNANNIRLLANTPLPPPAASGSSPTGLPQYADTQYTPSAQEAATGAFSASRQNNPQPPVAQPQTQPAPKPVAPRSTRKHRKVSKAPVYQSRPQTLATAPLAPPPSEQQLAVTDLPALQVPATTTTGLTDQELQQRDLPPLRGPWVRIQHQQRTPSPRDEAEMQLRSIESGYSGWLGGTGVLNYRSGDLGYDHLAALEAPFEASMPLGYNGRLTFVARPVFLDSGQATGTSVITVDGYPNTSGVSKVLITIPQPIGTMTTTDVTPPSQQNASGIGGEVQLAFPHLAIAGGYTPAGFLVATVTARMQWKPGNGPFTFSFNRDSVKDTQLSYSGLRNPAGDTLGNQGQVWGGVIANQANVQYARGDAASGFYIGAGGQVIRGYGVQDNTRIDGSGGAYWRLKTVPEYGNLSIGVNFFGMHYDKNEDAFTMGMGGYFSPQAYFLANVPFTWAGHYQTRWHYNIMGSLGVQAFQQDMTPLFPLAHNTTVTLDTVTYTNLQLPAKTSVGPNYDLRGQVAYQISPHWFAGGFFGSNNSRDYKSASAGFYVRYLFRSQPSTVTSPTGIFPTEGIRPFTVP
jgi:tetratricopeptide (TPR) repeat protein